MILRHWYLLTSSWPRLLELIYWPVLQLITWGFSQAYISQNAGFFAKAGGTFIGAVILWTSCFAASSASRCRFSKRCGRRISATF
jgi:ABC-2 type transport system permease protein